MRTIRRANRRGSILLLVVGLLTILGMLGGTFLLIARLNSKQSKALAGRGQVEQLASGVVTQIKGILKDDLKIGTNGPYANGIKLVDNSGTFVETKVTNGLAFWMSSVDMGAPRELAMDGSGNVYCGGDAWLSSGAWRSSVFGKFSVNADGGNLITAGNVPDVYDVNKDGTPVAVDTNGDGDTDAYLADMGVFAASTTGTDSENKYYMAVRVTDLASLVCLNTAGFPGDSNLPTQVSPVYVDMKTGLTDTYYANVNDLNDAGSRLGRFYTGAKKLDEYQAKCASRLLSPDPVYLPFAVSDEVFTRFVSQNHAGRLAKVFEGISSEYHKGLATYFTVFNCSRLLPKKFDSASGFTSRINITSKEDLEDNAKRAKLCDELAQAGCPTERVAHVVANLWAAAYAASEGESVASAAAAKRFEVAYGGTTAYALFNQPMITEAFATHTYATIDGESVVQDNWHWGCGIELMNPTPDTTINLANYRVVVSSTRPTDASAGTALSGELKYGDRFVIYNFGKGDTATADKNTFDFPSGAKAQQAVGLDFLGGKTVYLVRVTGDGIVVVDNVSAADLEYGTYDEDGVKNPFPVDLNGTTVTRNIHRDNRDEKISGNKYRYYSYFAIPEYQSNHGTDPKGHKLGDANDVILTDLTGYTDAKGFEIDAPAEITSLGHLSKLYCVGPTSDKTLPEVLKDANLLGSLPKRSIDFTRVDGTLAADGAYPDVPWATCLAELLKTQRVDPTRGNERVYGLININTASTAVLGCLPWKSIKYLDADKNEQTIPVNVASIVEYIRAYRERQNTGQVVVDDGLAGRQYSDRATSTGITGLRVNSPVRGFLTPGELAIPLANYVDDLLTKQSLDFLKTDPQYLSIRDSLYADVANLITVNSDVYAVNIRVQLGTNVNPDKVWYFVAVLDRSNCRTVDDEPEVLLFTQVK